MDDGSKDDTTEKAKKAGARVLRHVKNRGYGAALKTGIKAAKNEILVITDADGTYPSTMIPVLLEKIDNADMVVGSRTGKNVHIPLIRRPAKWILRKLAAYITGENIPDLNSGLRCFRKKAIMQYLPILSDKFSFTTTSTVAMLSDNFRVIYTPIDYLPRVGKSKIVPWDFVNFMTLVVRLSMLFNPLRIFLPVASLFIIMGLFKFSLDIVFAAQRIGEFSWEILKTRTISTTTLILLLSGLQILLIGMVSDGLIRKIAQRIPSEYISHSTIVYDESENED